ncbi:MAG: hypothetical protein ACRDLQ_03435 [Solirubrobacterales bacterium]
MKRIAVLAIACCALLVGACGDDDSGSGSENATTGSADAGSSLPQGSDPVELDPADFTTDIDNPYWPMARGNRWVSRSEDERVVVEVTNRRKDVAGIEAVVVRDTVTDNNGDLVEVTDDWYAQDSDGNIWYLGEDVKDYQGGKVVSTGGSWEHGVDGARAGIAIPADPSPGLKYRQEYYEGKAEDNAEVLSVTERVSVPAGTFQDCLQTRDTTPLEPDVAEEKHYARGVGPVLNVKVSGGSGREELVSFTKG